MLTTTSGTRTRLLQRLRRTPRSLSGERLAACLGVSRVAVWRHVRALQALGYPIDAGRQGYRLRAGADLLLPWEFPRLSRRLAWSAETASTMDDARRLAERGRAGRTVVVADRQSRGRGRNGRAWSSADGGLYATYLRSEPVSAALLPRVGLAAALAVATSLRRLYGLRASLEWPNDVLLEGRKLAGVLVESSIRADRLVWYAVGVGINVKGRPPVRAAVSLEQALGRPVRRAEVLDALSGEMDRRLDRLAASSLAAEWRSRSNQAGRMVEVATPLGRIRGVAAGIDRWGALVLRLPGGRLAHVPPAACLRSKTVN